jgi:hypothetical protein
MQQRALHASYLCSVTFAVLRATAPASIRQHNLALPENAVVGFKAATALRQERLAAAAISSTADRRLLLLLLRLTERLDSAAKLANG